MLTHVRPHIQNIPSDYILPECLKNSNTFNLDVGRFTLDKKIFSQNVGACVHLSILHLCRSTNDIFKIIQASTLNVVGKMKMAAILVKQI